MANVTNPRTTIANISIVDSVVIQVSGLSLHVRVRDV